MKEGARGGAGNAGINRYIRSTGFGGGCVVVFSRVSMWASRKGVCTSGILGVCLKKRCLVRSCFVVCALGGGSVIVVVINAWSESDGVFMVCVGVCGVFV